MVARYHINQDAYLPSGQVDIKGHPVMAMHVAPTEIEYPGDPSTQWTPLNEEAVEAMRAVMERVIALKEMSIEFVDVKSRDRPSHIVALNRLKAQAKNLRVGDAPQVLPPIDIQETMAAVQKAVTPISPQQPQQQQNKPNQQQQPQRR